MKAKTKQQPRRKFSVLEKLLVGLCMIPVFFVILWIFFSALNSWHNELVLERFSAPFYDYPLPAYTVELDRYSYVFYTGSHGCGFTAKRLIQTSLTQIELEEYFKGAGFKPAHGDTALFSDDGGIHIHINTAEAENTMRLTISDYGRYTHEDVPFQKIGCY
ncbi:MAG: hypothetical protein ACPG7F_15305 [Aggregatilineales bacterium]